MRIGNCYDVRLWALFMMVPGSLTGQITGQVVDVSGRALPNVVIVSRTGNGFLATRTDIDGRFAYPGRPHRKGHTIEASSAGFRSAVLLLEGDETQVTLTLRGGGTPGPGWTLGLPVRPRVTILDASGTSVSPISLLVDREYVLQVTMSAVGCTQASDAMVEERGDEVLIAIAAFTRSGSCSAAEPRILIPYRFSREGIRTIRAVGRNRDTRVDVSVLVAR